MQSALNPIVNFLYGLISISWREDSELSATLQDNHGGVYGYIFTYHGFTTFIPYATYNEVEHYYVLGTGNILEYPMIGDSDGMRSYMSKQSMSFFDSVPGTMLEYIPA